MLATLSGIGFVSSLVWHIAARLGLAPGMPPYAVALCLGVFVVAFPTMFRVHRFAKELRPFDIGALRYLFMGGPRWLNWLALLAFVYASINFLLAYPAMELQGDVTFGIGASGHAMAFYAIVWAINAASSRRVRLGIDWVCERGHQMSPSEKFCSACGAPARQSGSAGAA